MANALDAKIRPQEFTGPYIGTGRQTSRVSNIVEFVTDETDPSTAALLHGAGTSTSGDRIQDGGTANKNFLGYWVETTATSGDTRGMYIRLYFSGAGVSGEALRAYGTVNGVQAAVGGTVNGAHISLNVTTGGSISGAGHALRATYGVAASVTPGGTVSVLQLDSDFAASVGVGATTAFISLNNLGTAPTTNGIPLLFNIANPDTSTFFTAAGTGANSAALAGGGIAAKAIKCVVGGVDYWLPLFSSNSN